MERKKATWDFGINVQSEILNSQLRICYHVHSGIRYCRKSKVRILGAMQFEHRKIEFRGFCIRMIQFRNKSESGGAMGSFGVEGKQRAYKAVETSSIG